MEWEDHNLFMREEEGKVYWYNQEEIREEETILYDFNLKEGESISRYLDPYLDYIMISTLDSIRYIQIDNNPRKIFYISKSVLNSNWVKIPEIWIEGIGSLLGLNREEPCAFSTGCMVYQMLLCFCHSGQELYHSPDFNYCYYQWRSGSGLGLEVQKMGLTPDFQIYPNPSSGRFTIITNNGYENASVQIFDCTGKQIRSYPMGALLQMEMDVSDAPSGIYFVRIILQNGNIITLKLIKQ